MALIFRPASAAAAKHKGFADKLGATLRATGGSIMSRVYEGFLFRAVRASPNIVVYAIDPAAVWAFLHFDNVHALGTELILGSRALTRDLLRPAATAAFDVTPQNDSTALAPYQPGLGYYGSLDTGALSIKTNLASVALTTNETVSTSVLAGSTNLVEAPYSARFQVWADVFGVRGPKFYKAGDDLSSATAYYHRLYDFLFSETALASITGVSDARLYTRYLSRFTYAIPYFGAQSTAEGFASPTATSAWYSDPLVAGAYVSQPAGAAPPLPPSDPAWLGTAGTFIVRLRRPEAPTGNFYPLSSVGHLIRPMSANPEPELVPGTIVDGGVTKRAEHGVSGVALCYTLSPTDRAAPPDGLGARGTVHLFSHVYCKQGAVLWNAVQLQSLLPGGGASVSTLYKGSSGVYFCLGKPVTMFGVQGVYATRAGVVGSPASQNNAELVHLGVDGVIRATNLAASGWYTFVPSLAATLSVQAGSVFGQAPTYCADIGDNLIAVVAKNTTGDSGSATWSVVVVAADTGEFVEARGVLGSLSMPSYLVYLSVVTPQTTEGGITTPAVLAAGLGHNHYLSRDGGATWAPMFSGYIGHPLYLGNQLHDVTYGLTL